MPIFQGNKGTGTPVGGPHIWCHGEVREILIGHTSFNIGAML